MVSAVLRDGSGLKLPDKCSARSARGVSAVLRDGSGLKLGGALAAAVNRTVSAVLRDGSGLKLLQHALHRHGTPVSAVLRDGSGLKLLEMAGLVEAQDGICRPSGRQWIETQLKKTGFTATAYLPSFGTAVD